ncbi:MAG: chloride channel protein, partial [Bacteroidota bacterium]
AIFNTPIAGIVFALEVLMIDLTRFSLIPLLMASVSGAIVTKLMGEEAILFSVNLERFHAGEIPLYIVLGILTGLVSVYFTRMFIAIETVFEKIKSRVTMLITGGAILGVLIFIFPALYGEGYVIIESVLNGKYGKVMDGSFLCGIGDYTWGFILFFALLVFFKVIATASTIGSGGIGGIFAPSLFTGAITGFLFAHIINILGFAGILPENNFAFVGMAGLLCGVLHAPLTGIFLIAEITSGYELIVPLMLTTAMSFVTVKYFQPNSIFTIQLAQRGELITHHKDKAVLTFMKLHKVIETDLLTVPVEATLGQLVKIISRSKRNIFPVIDDDGVLQGIIYIENIREIMFSRELYDTTFVSHLMVSPPSIILSTDSMDVVAEKFKDNSVWNLPVVDKGKYIGFVSKSKLFSEYRNMLIDLSEE